MAAPKIIIATFEKLLKGEKFLECQRAEQVQKGRIATFSLLCLFVFPSFLSHSSSLLLLSD